MDGCRPLPSSFIVSCALSEAGRQAIIGASRFSRVPVTVEIRQIKSSMVSSPEMTAAILYARSSFAPAGCFSRSIDTKSQSLMEAFFDGHNVPSRRGLSMKPIIWRRQMRLSNKWRSYTPLSFVHRGDLLGAARILSFSTRNNETIDRGFFFWLRKCSHSRAA